jgi:hypothetical protein
LFSLPLDRRVAHAIVLPETLDDESRNLVVTLPIYPYRHNHHTVEDYDAFILPREKDQKPIQIQIDDVSRIADGGSVDMILDKTHEFRFRYVEWRIYIDSICVRSLPPEEVARWIQEDRIPGVPKTPTPLVAPFSHLLKTDPVV